MAYLYDHSFLYKCYGTDLFSSTTPCFSIILSHYIRKRGLLMWYILCTWLVNRYNKAASLMICCQIVYLPKHKQSSVDESTGCFQCQSPPRWCWCCPTTSDLDLTYMECHGNQSSSPAWWGWSLYGCSAVDFVILWVHAHKQTNPTNYKQTIEQCVYGNMAL